MQAIPAEGHAERSHPIYKMDVYISQSVDAAQSTPDNFISRTGIAIWLYVF